MTFSSSASASGSLLSFSSPVADVTPSSLKEVSASSCSRLSLSDRSVQRNPKQSCFIESTTVTSTIPAVNVTAQMESSLLESAANTSTIPSTFLLDEAPQPNIQEVYSITEYPTQSKRLKHSSDQPHSNINTSVSANSLFGFSSDDIERVSKQRYLKRTTATEISTLSAAGPLGSCTASPESATESAPSSMVISPHKSTVTSSVVSLPLPLSTSQTTSTSKCNVSSYLTELEKDYSNLSKQNGDEIINLVPDLKKYLETDVHEDL